MTLPNILTIIRLIIVPFFGISILHENYHMAVLLFSIAGISDVLDGYIARKYNLESNIGKVLDPIADKIMQFTAILMLTINGLVPVIIVIILGLKELMMGIGTIVLFKKVKKVKGASWYGKATTILIFISVVLILFDIHFGVYLLWSALVLALFSFIMYGVKAKKSLNEGKD